MSRMAGSIVLVGLVLGAVGCATRAPRATVLWNYPHATETTITQSPHEHYQSVANVAERDARALIEDLDLVFMTERPTRLTRWHDR